MDASKLSPSQVKYQELANKMAKQAGLKWEQLGKVQSSIIFAHYLNLQMGLQCVSRNGIVIQFPESWNQSNEGVYKFNYKFKKDANVKKENSQATVQFRFVDNQQEDGAISINYTVENSQDLHQYQLKYQKDKFQELAKNYVKHLESKLKGNKESQTNQNPRRLEPVWRGDQPLYQQPNIYPIPQNTSPYRPFNLPFSGGQYIGPDNQIFRGRGTNNPFVPFNPNPNPFNDLRRPPGSRYDPIDPFGSQGMDQNPNGGRDFTGFNSFGKPFGGMGSGSFNPGRFL